MKVNDEMGGMAPQADLARQDLIETVNRLIREGFDKRCVVAGLGWAVADTLTCLYGAENVPEWFHRWGEITAELRRES